MPEVVACRRASLREGQGRMVRVEGREIAIFLVGGRVYAIDNACLHTGAPLADGFVRGTDVVCAWHGWCYSLETGSHRTGFGDLPGVTTYEVVVLGDDVVVRVPG